MTGPVIALGWLLLAHLVADFVLQTDAIAAAKRGRGRRAFAFVVWHAVLVALCLVPFVAAFGLPGLWTLIAVSLAHAVLDAAKAELTRRVEGRARRVAAAIHEPEAAGATLGTAWTPIPAGLFVADQAGHVLVVAAAWWIWLRDAAVTSGFADAVSSATAGIAPADVHRAALWVIVMSALFIINVPAGSIFVGLLLRPDGASGNDASDRLGAVQPGAPSYRLRLGPLEGRIEPETPKPAPTLATPARVGSAVGILERLLILAFVLARADAAIGLVVAAKTLARFKQLDDREFAEYYLLGTLASVAVAALSGIVAREILAAS